MEQIDALQPQMLLIAAYNLEKSLLNCKFEAHQEGSK